MAKQKLYFTKNFTLTNFKSVYWKKKTKGGDKRNQKGTRRTSYKHDLKIHKTKLGAVSNRAYFNKIS